MKRKLLMACTLTLGFICTASINSFASREYVNDTLDNGVEVKAHLNIIEEGVDFSAGLRTDTKCKSLHMEVSGYDDDDSDFEELFKKTSNNAKTLTTSGAKSSEGYDNILAMYRVKYKDDGETKTWRGNIDYYHGSFSVF